MSGISIAVPARLVLHDVASSVLGVVAREGNEAAVDIMDWRWFITETSEFYRTLVHVCLLIGSFLTRGKCGFACSCVKCVSGI